MLVKKRFQCSCLYFFIPLCMKHILLDIWVVLLGCFHIQVYWLWSICVSSFQGVWFCGPWIELICKWELNQLSVCLLYYLLFLHFCFPYSGTSDKLFSMPDSDVITSTMLPIPTCYLYTTKALPVAHILTVWGVCVCMCYLKSFLCGWCVSIRKKDTILECGYIIFTHLGSIRTALPNSHDVAWTEQHDGESKWSVVLWHCQGTSCMLEWETKTDRTHRWGKCALQT